MRVTSIRRGLFLAILGGLIFADRATAEDRSPRKILAEIKAVDAEVPNRRPPGEPLKGYVDRLKAAHEKKADLIGELFRADPESKELDELLPFRWQTKLRPKSGPGVDEARAEMAAVLARGKSQKLVNEVKYRQTVEMFLTANPVTDLEKLGEEVEACIRRDPGHEGNAALLLGLARLTKDEARKDAINQRAERDYPNTLIIKTRLAGNRFAAAQLRQKDNVGKPFEIAFVDAIKGGEVSSKTLKGKVVVIDFWATWCVPCLQEMPKMKDLYAKYKDQGVEFVGVSLDSPKEDGGYDKLKEYVEKNKVEWPQFYQGKGWSSEFSSSLGIRSIPCVFLVDAEGILVSTEAAGRLEELIPVALEKAKRKTTGVGP